MFFLKLSMSILSLLSLEVKEISVKMRRFGTRLLQKPVGRFGTRPTRNTLYSTASFAAPELQCVGALTWGINQFHL